MKTHYLNISDEEHFEFDVFSIDCNESIYRVINDINDQLSISLEFTELLDLSHKEGEYFLFPVYCFKHQELNIEINLIPNETSLQPSYHHTPKTASFDLFAGDIELTVKLLPELSTTNYLLLIKGENRYLYNHTILQALKEITLFEVVKEIFIEDLADKSSRNHLLF